MTKAIDQGSSDQAQDAPAGSFRQAMTWLHTWAGLPFGWLLFFMFVTGTAGYFDTEIDRWMQPELPPAQSGFDVQTTTNVLLERLQGEAPDADQWLLSLPTDRNQPYASIFWRGASVEAGASTARGSLTVDAITGEILQGRETGGGQLLYQMHWLLHYADRSYSDWIITLATLFMMVALVTGVIIHKRIFRDFFVFRPGKGQRSWLDAHNILSVASLPFQLMITYSGLMFMGFSFMPLIVGAHYEGRGPFYDQVFSPPGLVEAAGEAAPLVPLSDLLAEAETRWGEDRILSIDIRHPGDRNARVVISENIDASVAAGAGRLVFDGSTGNLLHVAPSASSAVKGVRDVFLGLHEGLFAPPVLRWLYFLAGLMGTGMVATGLIMWGVKRRQKAERKSGAPPPGLILVEKLNAGTVAGLLTAVAAYFWANRLIPADMDGRADWEAHAMFLTWFACLIHAAMRSRERVWFEQVTVAALAFISIPVINGLTTERHLINSLATGDWVFAGFDLSVLSLGLALGCIAGYLRSKQREGRVSRTAERPRNILERQL